jgi:type VI secretion system protein ImpA
MDSILQPISSSAYCGEYLKGNKNLYRALRNSFNQAQSSYRQLMESPEAGADDDLVEQNIENWRELAGVCSACLTDNSKDVEVFGWFISAQLFTGEPLANLQSAISVFTTVVEDHWDDLQPRPPVEKLKSEDEAGKNAEWAAFKVKPMWQLAGETEGSGILAMPLLNMPLVGDINYTAFFSAERAGTLEELKEEAGRFFTSDKDEVTERILILASIETAIKKLEVVVNAHCQSVSVKGISFKFLLKLLADLLRAMKYLVASSYSEWPLDEQQEANVASESAPETGSIDATDSSVAEPNVGGISSAQANQRVVMGAGEPLYTRDQAFTELRKVADFFQRTEPHSPVYMLLERAIRWGYMSLPELLEEMVGENDQVMNRINQLAGLESVTKTVIPQPSLTVAELQQHRGNAQPAATSAVQADTAPQKSVAASEQVVEKKTTQATPADASEGKKSKW